MSKTTKTKKRPTTNKLDLSGATFKLTESGLIVSKDGKTYDFRGCREALVQAYLDGCGFVFEGAVSSVLDERELVFERLRVMTTLFDGTMSEGAVDHVHIFEAARFKQAEVGEGNFVRFSASPYPYQRKDGTCDFGLERCCCIEKIEAYEFPTKEEMRRQAAEQLVCGELCPLSYQCYGMFCMRPDGWRESLVAALMDA